MCYLQEYSFKKKISMESGMMWVVGPSFKLSYLSMLETKQRQAYWHLLSCVSEDIQVDSKS